MSRENTIAVVHRDSSASQLVKNFRDDVLKMSQEEFAEKLDITRVAVVRWEAKASEPSAEKYISLAKLAQEHGHSDWAIRFYGKAGIDSSSFRALLPEFDKMVRRSRGLSIKPPTGGDVGLPMVAPSFFNGNHESVIARLRSMTLDSDGIETFISFPRDCVKNHSETIAVRAPDDYMRPIFRKGNILAVDVSFSVIAPVGSKRLLEAVSGNPDYDPSAYFYRTRFPMVAAYFKPGSRNAQVLRPGLHIRDIHFAGAGEVANIHLGTQVYDIYSKELSWRAEPPSLPKGLDSHEAQEASDIIITGDPRWSIIGVVVGWVGSSARPKVEQK